MRFALSLFFVLIEFFVGLKCTITTEWVQTPHVLYQGTEERVLSYKYDSDSSAVCFSSPTSYTPAYH
jgi:hypothetical protein